MKKYIKYKDEKVEYVESRMAYRLKCHKDMDSDQMELWTVFTKDEHCSRGDYSEEIDILVPRHLNRYPTESMHISAAVIAQDFINIRPVTAVYRPSFF